MKFFRAEEYDAGASAPSHARLHMENGKRDFKVTPAARVCLFFMSAAVFIKTSIYRHTCILKVDRE
jgi:hypothetical protein